MGLNLLQTASSQDRNLGSDPLGLTVHQGPGHGGFRGFLPRFCAKTSHTGSGLKTDPGEDQAGLPALTRIVRCQTLQLHSGTGLSSTGHSGT